MLKKLSPFDSGRQPDETYMGETKISFKLFKFFEKLFLLFYHWFVDKGEKASPDVKEQEK